MQPGKARATCALIFGALAAIPGLGVGFGLVAMIVGINVLARRKPGAGMAITGLVLGVVLGVISSITGLLLVGITRYVSGESTRRQTVGTQRVVMNAIERYRDATGSSPADSDDCVSLMTTLLGSEGSKGFLRELSAEVWKGSGHPLLDGFGQPMRYEQEGGFGGSPVLISKGADRVLGNSDDIRSDRQ